MQGAAAQEASGAGQPDRPQGRPGIGVPAAVRGLIVLVAGALLTAGIAAFALAPGSTGQPLSDSSAAGEPTLSALLPGEIGAAVGTLDPATSQQAVADAKACKVPMATVTVVKQVGGPDGTVRIRSGSYLSPPFRVTDVAQRIAIPYPAPYATGHGVLSVVGEANGFAIYLTPGWQLQALNGPASISVVWTPGKPC